MIPEIRFQRLPGADPNVPLPGYATAGAAGADLRANLPAEARASGLTLAPMERLLVPTGLACALPEGIEMQIRARSGLALRHGIALPNAPATIDSDYRGPIGVILLNLVEGPFTVEHGARIAQIVLAPVLRARMREVSDLPPSDRGAGGFGSTGVA